MNSPEQSQKRTVRIVTASAIVLICLWYLFGLPARDPIVMIDHHVFGEACHRMHAGAGYYDAMDASLRATYGPSESLRAFRMPTVFLLWSLAPSDRWLWVLLVFLAGLTGFVFMGLCETPVGPPLVVIYLLAIGRFQSPEGSMAQFLTVELWAVPALAAGVLAWRRQRWVLAAGFCLLAVLIRETAAGVLLAGLVWAQVSKRPRWPWLVAGVLAGAAYLAHALCVSPYLVAAGQGGESALLGTADFPMSILRMAGFALPGGPVAGLVLWLLAVRWMWRSADYSWFPGLYLALPLVGVLVERPLWGILVVPFTLVWGIDSAVDLVHIYWGSKRLGFSAQDQRRPASV